MIRRLVLILLGVCCSSACLREHRWRWRQTAAHQTSGLRSSRTDFPRFVYTWRMKDDGSYCEDGRDEMSLKPIQRTLSGRWSRDGSRMQLKQDDRPFVFDGVVLGGLYTGTLCFL